MKWPVLSLAFLVPVTVTAQWHYKVIDLDPGEPGRSSAAVSVSGDRTVAFNVEHSRAFRWTPSTGRFLLPPFIYVKDGASLAASSGQGSRIVGTLSTDQSSAVVWDKNGAVTRIPYLPGFNLSRGQDINDAGQICGYNRKNNSHMAFRYGTSLEALPPLIGTESVGTAINKFGWVAGDSGKTNEATATLWKSPTNAVLLGTLPGFSYSSAQDVNDSGDVVGYANGGNGSGTRPFVWRQSTGMQPLESLGLSGSASSINGPGQAVGQLNGIGAVLWEPYGTVIDLTSRLDESSQGWRLIRAEGINNGGDIVGIGSLEGQSKAFLAVPFEPGTTLPTRYNSNYGFRTSGDIYSLYVPNGDGMEFQPIFIFDRGRTTTEFFTWTSVTQPNSLVVKGRWSVKNANRRAVTLRLFNYQAGSYDGADTLRATLDVAGKDFVVTCTGALARYVSANGDIKVQVDMGTGPNMGEMEQLVIDQLVWKIN